MIASQDFLIYVPTFPYEKSRYSQSTLTLYNNYFGNLLQQTRKEICLSKAEVIEHRVFLSSSVLAHEFQKESYLQPKVILIGLERGGSLATYHVLIGPFALLVRMLNIDQQANGSGKCLGKGTYGAVLGMKMNGLEYVAKRIELTKSAQMMNQKGGANWRITAVYSQVTTIIAEYAFARLASLLGVGPRICLNLSFDLVCYRDCVEFYMEKCEPAGYRETSLPFENIEVSLKQSLLLLHKCHIVHKDIKPPNIMYSPYHKKHVFCDFGISTVIPEISGVKSTTFREGTEGFMSPFMTKLQCKAYGHIDLYFNDAYGLFETMKHIDALRTNQSVPKPIDTDFEFDEAEDLYCLSEILKGTHQPNSKTNWKMKAIQKYFPELQGGPPTVPIPLNLDFLLSSYHVSSETERYLLECNQQDPKVQHLMKQLTCLAQKGSRQPFRQYTRWNGLNNSNYNDKLVRIWEKELRRLSQLPSSQQDVVKKWKLMKKLLVSYVLNRSLAGETRRLMDIFKTKNILSDQDETILSIELCRKIIQEESIHQSQLQSVLEKCISIQATQLVAKCFTIQGDFQNAFNSYLSVKIRLVDDVERVMKPLRKCYSMLSNITVLAKEQLSQSLAQLPAEKHGADKLRLINLLALVLTVHEPCKAVELCLQHLDSFKKSPTSLYWSLYAACRAQRDYPAAIAWLQQYIDLNHGLFGESEDYFTDSIQLCCLQLKVEGDAASILVRIREHNRMLDLFYGQCPIFRAEADSQIVDALIESHRFNEAYSFFTLKREEAVSKELGMFGLIRFHYDKARLLTEQYLSMSYSAIEAQRRARIEEELKKAMSLLEANPRLAFMKSSVYLSMAFCLVAVNRLQESEKCLRVVLQTKSTNNQCNNKWKRVVQIIGLHIDHIVFQGGTIQKSRQMLHWILGLQPDQQTPYEDYQELQLYKLHVICLALWRCGQEKSAIESFDRMMDKVDIANPMVQRWFQKKGRVLFDYGYYWLASRYFRLGRCNSVKANILIAIGLQKTDQHRLCLDRLSKLEPSIKLDEDETLLRALCAYHTYVSIKHLNNANEAETAALVALELYLKVAATARKQHIYRLKHHLQAYYCDMHVGYITELVRYLPRTIVLPKAIEDKSGYFRRILSYSMKWRSLMERNQLIELLECHIWARNIKQFVRLIYGTKTDSLEFNRKRIAQHLAYCKLYHILFVSFCYIHAKTGSLDYQIMDTLQTQSNLPKPLSKNESVLARVSLKKIKLYSLRVIRNGQGQLTRARAIKAKAVELLRAL